jgi:hypothetical protein
MSTKTVCHWPRTALSHWHGLYYDDVAKLDGEWKFTHRLFVPVYRRTDWVTGQVLTPRFALLRPTSV